MLFLWLQFLANFNNPGGSSLFQTHKTEQDSRVYKCSLCLCLQVEVKPYVLDDQMCDECQGARCGGKFAPFFCANVTCLQYYCEYCWASIHSRAGREFHKPLVKEGGDRPRHVSFRWSWWQASHHPLHPANTFNTITSNHTRNLPFYKTNIMISLSSIFSAFEHLGKYEFWVCALKRCTLAQTVDVNAYQDVVL